MYVAKHFVPLAMDTYFRGSVDDIAFCKKLGAGGNHVVIATASGHRLGGKRRVRLREKDLKPLIDEFLELDVADRQPKVAPVIDVRKPRRVLPTPPRGGLIVKGYCTYARIAPGGRVERASRFYYKENPNRWAAETQSDMLWLTETEWKSLVPAEPKEGESRVVAISIQRRFFTTIGIDFIEGSVNSLPAREMEMTLIVEKVSDSALRFRVDGYAKLGRDLDEESRTEAHSRGCEVRVLGVIEYDRKGAAFTRFDIVGVGRAWGNKMNYVRREIRGEEHPWSYAIACELVEGDTPMDRIPPYNLLHYGKAGPYFER
jgi:hypothetical protein